jgi:hypothetical protein
MTNADPVWAALRRKSDIAAQAAAGETIHAASPPPISKLWTWLQHAAPSLQLTGGRKGNSGWLQRRRGLPKFNGMDMQP